MIAVMACLAMAGDIPFDPTRGLVEVDVTIDGRVKARFGIDTGADRLYIDRGFAERNNLSVVKSGPQRDIVGVEGVSKASSIDLRSLQIGKERLYNLRATAIDLGNLIKDQRKGYPDGLLGHEILRRFYVTVDYPHRKLQMQMEEPRFLSKRQYRTVPFETARHLILVEVTFNDTVTATMVLDYCASHTTITPSLARKLGVDTTLDSRTFMESVRLGDDIATRNVLVVVTDLDQIRKSVRRADLDGILGSSFLCRHKITVDYKRKKIYVHKK